MNFPLWLQAGFWGFVAGAALLVGALLGYFFNLPQRLTAAVMAFGSGVLVSALGFAVFKNFSPDVIAAITAEAAGSILAMLADTMIPEAFEETHNYAGFITVLGFLAAFVLTKLQT